MFLFHAGTIPLFCSEHFIVELAGHGRMPSLLTGFGDLIALSNKEGQDFG